MKDLAIQTPRREFCRLSLRLLAGLALAAGGAALVTGRRDRSAGSPACRLASACDRCAARRGCSLAPADLSAKGIGP